MTVSKQPFIEFQAALSIEAPDSFRAALSIKAPYSVRECQIGEEEVKGEDVVGDKWGKDRCFHSLIRSFKSRSDKRGVPDGRWKRVVARVNDSSIRESPTSIASISSTRKSENEQNVRQNEDEFGGSKIEATQCPFIEVDTPFDSWLQLACPATMNQCIVCMHRKR